MKELRELRIFMDEGARFYAAESAKNKNDCEVMKPADDLRAALSEEPGTPYSQETLQVIMYHVRNGTIKAEETANEVAA